MSEFLQLIPRCFRLKDMIIMITLYNLVGQLLHIRLVSQLLIFASFLLFLFYLNSCFFFLFVGPLTF